MVTQENLNNESNIGKKKGTGGIRLPDLRVYYKAMVIKRVWYWHKNKYSSKEQDIKSKNKPENLWSVHL